jgi:hypothetical protein
MAVRTIAKVADSYKISKKVQIKFKKYSGQPFDSRIFRFIKNDLVSITTLAGREKIPFQYGKYQRQLLQTQKGEVDLLYIKKQFYIACPCDVEEEQIQETKGTCKLNLSNFSRLQVFCGIIKKKNMVKMLAIILAIIIGIGSVYLLGNDNPVEEIAEKIIEEEIRIDVDLTPNSKKHSK